MLREYQIATLDHLVAGESVPSSIDNPAVCAALDRVRYSPLLKNWQQSLDSSVFLLNDDYNRRLKQAYWEMATQAHRIAPCGELVFENISCLGFDGLKADLDHGVVFIGHAVNWGRDYFDWWLPNSNLGFVKWSGDNGFLADFGPAERQDDNVVMMKFPGYGIYGHWLLDLIPQIYLTRFMAVPDGTRSVFNPLTEWMQALIRASALQHVESYESKHSTHRNLHAPTGLKNGYALGQPINGLAWEALRTHFNHLNCRRPASGVKRIFVSRRNWIGQRPLTNYEALEQQMASQGFEIYYPELHSLQDQAYHFSEAEVVIGEDGSGLHSIMLSNPRAKLGVLMHANRMNLWHAGICHAMGHAVAYSEIIIENDTPKLDLAKIKNFVSDLIDA